MRWLVDFLTRPAFKFVLMLLIAAVVLFYVVRWVQHTAPAVNEPSAPKQILDKVHDAVNKDQQIMDENLKQAQKVFEPPTPAPAQ
jgi:hypothetical protein